MSKLFEVVYESSRDVSSILEDLALAFIELDSAIKAYFCRNDFSSIKETTTQGEKHYSVVLEAGRRVQKLINELKTHINNKSKRDAKSFEHISAEIDTIHTPNAIAMYRLVHQFDYYDDEDKERAHKICTAYKQLVDQYRFEVDRYNNLFSTTMKKPQTVLI